MGQIDLRKVTPEDVGHVILQIVVLIAEIAGHCILNVIQHRTCLV